MPLTATYSTNTIETHIKIRVEFMKIRTILAVGIVAALTNTSAVLAGGSGGSVGSGPNPFVDCGIGAALFPDTHWAAVISNVIWDVGTTAMTSATMSPETCKGSKVAAAKFITETYANVVEETAVGQGEHITAMLDIFGCSADSHTSIVSSIRGDVALFVGSSAYSQVGQVEKAAAYYEIVNSEIASNFSASCSV